MINAAQGSAEAVIVAGKARAKSIELVAEALSNQNGHNAANLAVAEKYVTAFQELAKTNNTLILPANTGDVSSMVAQVGFKITILYRYKVRSKYHIVPRPSTSLKKWFIISGDGVRPYIRTKQNKPIKDSTFQASALVGAWAWIIVQLKSCFII